MPKYVIEREIPNAGKLSPAELQGISQKSCSVMQSRSPNSMGGALRHRRQNLLRLYCFQQRNRGATRQAGWLSQT